MRLFVAVDLTPEARQALAASLDGLEMPGRAVAPPDWHITLRFIGDVDEVTCERLVAELDQADLGEAFRLRWGRLGAFPRPARATVLWVDVAQGAEPLQALAGAVETAVTTAGVAAEDRPFRPHLTLSRIRPQEDVSALLGSVPAMEVRMSVEHVILFRSHLERGGSRYEWVETFALR